MTFKPNTRTGYEIREGSRMLARRFKREEFQGTVREIDREVADRILGRGDARRAA